MTSIMRRTVRGAAAGLGALAIVAGAAACGGSDEETATEDPAVEATDEADEAAEEDAAEEAEADAEEDAAADEEAAEDDAADEGDDAAAEEGDDSAEPIDEAGLTAAGDRFLEFIQVMDDGDGEAACAFFIDPTTDEPVTGATLTQCGETLAPQMESMEPGSMDMVDRSMVETTDNGDGTVSVAMMGTDFPYTMVQGADGEWYLSLS